LFSKPVRELSSQDCSTPIHKLDLTMSEISQVMQEADTEQNARQPNLVISGWAALRLEGCEL